MKILSIFLITFYLLLPVVCLAHPCALDGELPHQQAVDILAAEYAGECPIAHDSDHCETTCCCAGSLLSSPSGEVSHRERMTRKLPADPYLVLPRLSDRIFIPPQIVFGTSVEQG